MKPRDAAAMLADHRRQAPVPPAPKKKAPAPKPKAPTTATSSSSSTSKSATAKKPADITPAAPKKNGGAKLSKAAKKKAAAAAAEKEKAAPATITTTTTTTAALTKQQQQQQQQQRVQLDPDSHKSRNHTLFLAPSGLAPPSWGNRSRKEATTLSVAERLHTEILEYAQYTRSTVEDMAVLIEVMIANVRACVQSLWPRSTVETFGSYSTGIWLPSSDVDLVILNVVEVNDAVVTGKNLRRLAKALESQAWVHSLLVLDTAKIPVLKLVSADTRVPIDITFESSTTHSGLIARDIIKRYNEQLPELYPLAVVFKQLLRERDLNDAYTGGLSSYSIVLMIVHFSQLWRNGERCFQAASIYASGSLPPAPAVMAARAAAESKATASKSGKAEAAGSTPAEVGSPMKLPAAPTSSYASIVSRSNSHTQSGSETGGKADSSDASSESTPVQRFSYAAVAAGIVKVSPEEEAKAKKSAPAPPSSYAAAVAAAAGSKSSAAVARSSAAAKKPSSASSGGSSAAGSIPASEAQLDSVSVTSSNADTEDSSSSCSSSLAADSDDESNKQQQQISERMCLGEHTMLLLEYFGILFDYRKNGISIRDGGYIYRLAEHGAAAVGKPALVIEDPIHPDRNVSASSFAFSKVVAVFEDAFYALKYFRPSKFAPSALSCLLSSSGHSSHTSKSSR